MVKSLSELDTVDGKMDNLNKYTYRISGRTTWSSNVLGKHRDLNAN